MKNKQFAVCLSIVALVVVQPAFAKDKAKASAHKEIKSKRAVIKAAPPAHPWAGHTVTLSDSERHAIRAYVFDRVQASKGGKFNGVPQGLARKVTWSNKLPAGWQKHCVRGQALPAEVHKHCQPLPHDIRVKLPPQPPGTILLAVDGTVIRVGYPTYEVLDVFVVL